MTLKNAFGVRKYAGQYPSATRDLYSLGLLKGYPVQKPAEFMRDSGINIRYSLKGCTPEKFRTASNLFLDAAKDEAERYPEYKWRFARFEVQLNRTAKGRKSLPLQQTYTAGKHTDSEIMVYGPRGGVPDEVTNFLIDQVEKIIDLPMRYTGKVNKQRPYHVLYMEVCLRKGSKD